MLLRWISISPSWCHRLVALQRVEGIPRAYASARDAVLDLVKELRTVLAVAKQFDSKEAGLVMDELIDLVIETLMKISERYSRSKYSESFRLSL